MTALLPNQRPPLHINHKPRAIPKKLQVPFFRFSHAEDEIAAVTEVIRSGWLTTAARAAEFEKRFADYIGVKHALAVSSGTAALHLALEGSGITENDRVAVPVHTFTATAEVARYMGAELVFVDVDKQTFCIDPLDLKQKLERPSEMTQDYASKASHLTPGRSAKTKAIMPVHFGGHPCDMDEILLLAKAFDLKIIEDSAHALPAYYTWKNNTFMRSIVGTIGDVTCFSFYANKTITTGEGGMLATDDDKIFQRAKIMRLHGIDRDIWDRYLSPSPSWYYEVVAPGFKYNMTDIAAAIGIKQLEKCNAFHQKRANVAHYYMDNLGHIEGLRIPRLRCAFRDHAWHLFVVLIDPPEENGRISRDDFIAKLSEMGVTTAVHYIPLHFHPYYRNRYRLRPEDFPNSTWIYKRCVSLPIFPDMTDYEVEYVVQKIKEVMTG